MSTDVAYVVIRYSPPPSRNAQIASQTWPASSGPTVKIVTADNPRAAATSAGVPPGAHAVVYPLSAGRRFDRPKQAELIEKRPDGNPLDVAA